MGLKIRAKEKKMMGFKQIFIQYDEQINRGGKKKEREKEEGKKNEREKNNCQLTSTKSMLHDCERSSEKKTISWQSK